MIDQEGEEGVFICKRAYSTKMRGETNEGTRSNLIVAGRFGRQALQSSSLAMAGEKKSLPA